jgi:hypothetical protein
VVIERATIVFGILLGWPGCLIRARNVANSRLLEQQCHLFPDVGNKPIE